jgi:hypothetical protein
MPRSLKPRGLPILSCHSQYYSPFIALRTALPTCICSLLRAGPPYRSSCLVLTPCTSESTPPVTALHPPHEAAHSIKGNDHETQAECISSFSLSHSTKAYDSFSLLIHHEIRHAMGGSHELY